MACFTCNPGPWSKTALGSSFAALSRAAAKSAAAGLRNLGALQASPQWAIRAAVCERCPLRVVRAGISYCGKPFLNQVAREPADGCGCPTREKAKSPGEHCPLDSRHRPAANEDGTCNCKWCKELR